MVRLNILRIGKWPDIRGMDLPPSAYVNVFGSIGLVGNHSLDLHILDHREFRNQFSAHADAAAVALARFCLSIFCPEGFYHCFSPAPYRVCTGPVSIGPVGAMAPFGVFYDGNCGQCSSRPVVLETWPTFI